MPRAHAGPCSTSGPICPRRWPASSRRRSTDTAEAFRQHRPDDRRAVRGHRHGRRNSGRTAPSRRARFPRLDAGAGCRRAWLYSWPSRERGRLSRHECRGRHWPARRRTTGGRTTCWRTTIGRGRSKRRFRCSRRSSRKTRDSLPPSPIWGAPTSCSSPSSATRSTSNRHANPRCVRSRWRPAWRRRT